MRGSVLALSLALVLMLPAATAQEDGADLVLDGLEGPDCGLPKLICFQVAEGDLGTVFVAGQEVTVTLRAVGDAPHNVHVAISGDEDANNLNTEPDAAFASSETAEGGGETTFTFTVPADAEELYLWCDIGEHEAAGMWLYAPVNAAPEEPPAEENETPEVNETPEENETPEVNDTPPANESPEEEEETDDSPMGLFVVLAGVTLAALARRR